MSFSCRFHGEYGKLRTDDLTIMAVHALASFLHKRGVIAFFVEIIRQFKNVPGAELDAIAASFTAIIEDMNLPLGYFD